MRVRLNRRLGQNEAGAELEVTETEAEWLIGRGYAERISNGGNEGPGHDRGRPTGRPR